MASVCMASVVRGFVASVYKIFVVRSEKLYEIFVVSQRGMAL